jgi:hypothetical protein
MYDCTKLTPTIIETITRLIVYNHNKVYESKYLKLLLHKLTLVGFFLIVVVAVIE